MAQPRVAALTLLLALSGCAGTEVLTGIGESAVDAHLQPGQTRSRAVPLAKRAAVLAAQRDLIERYAGTFLASETAMREFAAEAERRIAPTGGLVRGVRLVRLTLSPDRTVYQAEVEAWPRDLRRALGDGPKPRANAEVDPIVWPEEVGGGPVAANERLHIDPKLTTLTAKGVGVAPPGVDDRRAAARRAETAARAAAFRNLADQVKDIRLGSATTVRDYVADKPELRARLDTVVQGAKVVSEAHKPDGSVEAVASLAAKKVRAALGL